MHEEPDQSLLEFLYACPVGLVEIDRIGTILMINPHAMKHLMPIAAGLPQGLTNLFNVFEGCAPELRNRLDYFEPLHGIVCEGHRITIDLRREKGRARKVLSCTLVKLGADRAMVTISDITVQVQHEDRLRLAETWFGSLLGGVNDYAALGITSEGMVASVNESFTRQTGHAHDTVIGLSLALLLDTDPASGSLCLADQLQIAEREGWFLDEHWQRRLNGERYRCQRLLAVCMSDDGETVAGYTVILRDVAHHASDASDLRRLLTQDHLTGAVNRTHFLQRFETLESQSTRKNQPLSLVMIDIDHFKSINDRYGHPVGDIVLRAFVTACTDVLRPGDLFARVGGEEFAVLLAHTTLAEALLLAERLRDAVATTRIAIPGGEISITASFGCVMSGDRLRTVDAIISTADTFLYEAKRSGRNRVCGPQAVAVAA